MVARPGMLYPAKHEFLYMLCEAMLRERVAPDFVWQGWDERVIRRQCLRQRNILFSKAYIFLTQDAQDLYIRCSLVLLIFDNKTYLCGYLKYIRCLTHLAFCKYKFVS